MLRFIKRLFGAITFGAEPKHSRTTDLVPERTRRSAGRRATDAYFGTMARMQTAVSNRDYEGAARLVRKNLQYIPDWVRECCSEYGSFDISSIPALEQGGTVLALVGDDEGLARMQEIVASVPDLESWSEEVERHQYDRRLFQAILATIAAHPNCLQTEVKELVGEADGRRVANLLSYLDKAGKVVRIKAGRTYRLLPPDSPELPVPPPKLTG